MNVKEDLENKLVARKAREKQLAQKVEDIVEESKQYDSIVTRLISEYSIQLDSFSTSMDRLVKDIRSGAITNYSDLQLEMRCIVLAHALHKATEGLGDIGSKSDVARMAREQKFAEVYKQIKGGTIPDKKAEAEEYVLTEKQVEALFQRAYQTLSSKIKSGNRVLEAVKKVLTSRLIAQEVWRKEFSGNISQDEYNLPDELKEEDPDDV